MDQNNQYLSEDRENEDILRVIFKYLQYWPWFVGVTLLALIMAGLYLRYSTEIYQTETQIKILDPGEGGLDLSGLQGGGPLWDISEVNLENEIEILTSRRLIKKVIEESGLNTLYYSIGQIKTNLLWKEQIPFTVNWKLPDSLIKEDTPMIYLDFVSDIGFQISTDDVEPSQYTYGESISIADHTFKIVPNPYHDPASTNVSEGRYAFRYIPTHILAPQLASRISIQPVGETSDILNISIKGPNPDKNEVILNNLVDQFNEDGIEDRRLVSKRTGMFIEERLNALVKELDTVETKMVEFKQENDLVTLQTSTQQLFVKEGEADLKSFEVATQLSMAKSFKEALLQGGDFELLPTDIGMNASITGLTDVYNQLVLRRQELLVSATQQSPLIIQVEEKLNQIKKNIISSVDSYINSLEISLEGLRQRESISSSGLNAIPKKQKIMRIIQRQQAVKEKLFLFLLQKREEAALSYAITSPSIKVVDYAYTSRDPVSPKRKIILLTALILGLLVPFGILYVYFLLNTKVQNKEQIEALLKNIPIIGEIPRLTKKENHIIHSNDRSALAESFRILRTNISYFKPKSRLDGRGQVIYIASAAKGEGKTFTAVNLAITLASANKRVLLIGSDLRNPQLHNFINKDKSTTGMSSFFFEKDMHLSDIILKDPLKIGDLDVVLSGNIPPNPAELLIGKRFGELIEEARTKYDYVLVDTAPTILVTDTLLISNYADVTVFLFRAGVTDHKMVEYVNELQKSKKMNNIAVVINDLTKNGGYGYNYGYGYGYDDKPVKSRWKFWEK